MMNKISEEKLDQVTGGSSQEMKELKEAFLGNPSLKPIWVKYLAECGGDEYAATTRAVKEVCNLEFTAGTGAYPNIYDYDTAHDEILRYLYYYY